MNSSLRAHAAVAAILASTALVVFAAPAMAAPPANDNLADAQPVGPTLPVIGVTGTTVAATTEPGEPSPMYLAFPFQSVWYALDVPAAGDYADLVTVSTCPESGGNGDYIDVYAVTGPGFGGLSRQDRFGGLSRVCEFTFVVAEGTQYRIVVDRANDGGAPHSLSVAEYTPPPGPANDALADAQPIGPNLPIEGISGTTENATPEIGEPAHGNLSQAYRSVWYALDVPAAAGYPDVVTVDTCGEFGGGNSYVAVYAVTGPGFGGLVEQAPAAGEQSCAFTFAVTEGSDYRIAVDDINGGDVFELSVAALDPPANDDFENRELIPPELPQELAGSTSDASAEEDESEHGREVPERSVWYEWTGDVDQPVKIDVCESDSEFGFEPEIAVYTSGQEDPTFFDLNRIAANDGRGCTLVFDPAGAETSGTVYIAVDGHREETDFNLKLASANPPPNDNFADRQVIPSSLPQTLPGTTFDAGAEEGEPAHDLSEARRSVWYEWGGGVAGTVKVDVCDAELREIGLAVYVSSAGEGGTPDLSNLHSIADNQSQDCSLSFNPGGEPKTFYISVDSGTAEGAFNLKLRVASPPANDDFADAIPVGPGLPVSVDGTNVDATAEQDEPFGEDAHSVWYSWTPDVTQSVVVHTCTSSLESALDVFTGSGLDGLSEVDGDRSYCPGTGRGQRVYFEATEGTTYLIPVDGEREGTFTLRIQVPGLAPDEPTVTGISPASGSNDNDPKVIGTAEAGATVGIYTDPVCDDVPLGVGTASEFSSPGIPVHVEDNTTRTFYARASNVDGDSVCSTTSVTYSEVTPSPPAAPSFTSSSPVSGADDNDPELIGTAVAGTTVRIYTNSTCTSAVAGTGSAALFSGAGVTVHVGDDTTTTFYATAQDANGTSGCSSGSMSYQEVSASTPPPGGGQPPADPGPAKVKCPKGKVVKKGKCVKKRKPRKKKA